MEIRMGLPTNWRLEPFWQTRIAKPLNKYQQKFYGLPEIVSSEKK